MAPGQIDSLFYTKRVPDGLPFLLFLFYVPVGLFLFIIRVLFCVQLVIILSILPKGALLRRWILRTCGCILGIVSSSKREGSSSAAKIFVANNISELDCLVMEAIEPHMLISRNNSLPLVVRWLMGYQGCATSKVDLVDQLKKHVTNHDNNFPALVFPEESSTNGKISLLKFSNLYFQLSEAYQPVILTARRPAVLPVKLSMVNGGFWSDLFWTFFVPYTFYQIRYLPCIEKTESLSADEFAKLVYKEMSESLGLMETQFDVSDKREFIRRLQHVQPEIFQKRQQPLPTAPPLQRFPCTVSSKIEDMTRQVKDVLPQVPYDVIRRDLAKSKSVDTTIANLLEGRILYTPLTTGGVEDERKQQEIKKAQALKISSNQTKFSSNQRGLSFQEKKIIMVEEAKRRYLEKHPEFSC